MEMSLWKSLANLDRAAARMGHVFDEPSFMLGRGLPNVLAGGLPNVLTGGFGAAMMPAADIHEDAKFFTVSVDVPGVSAEQLHVEVDGRKLTVHGERKIKHADKQDKYLFIERRYGDFRRTFTLPASADTSKAKAERHNGVLVLTVPKNGGAITREIPVS